MPGDARDARSSFPDHSKKEERSIKRSVQFRRVFRRGRNFRGSAFRAVYVKNSLGIIRLGFSLSAKSGNSVKRNLFRRRIKSLSLERQRRTDQGIDVIILPVGKLGGKTWKMILKDYRKFEEEIDGNDRIPE